MSVLERLAFWRKGPSDRDRASLVRLLIDRCEPAVWERVAAKAQRMSPAEARGYIRARAASVIHDQTHRALSTQTHWPTAAKAEVLDAATGGIVRQIHHRLLNARYPIVERRKAA